MFVISKLRRTSDFNSVNLPLRIGNNINFIQDVVHSALPWAIKGTKFELLYMPQRNKMMQPCQFSTIYHYLGRIHVFKMHKWPKIK